MSALHAWHREHFSKLTEVEKVFPAYSTTFGGNFPEVRHKVKLPSARAVVAQRIVNGLSPEAWKVAQAAFDASPEGTLLASKDAAVRREHCELWLLRALYESDHPDMVPVTELALEQVKDHHCASTKLDAQCEHLFNGFAKNSPKEEPDAPACPSEPEVES